MWTSEELRESLKDDKAANTELYVLKQILLELRNLQEALKIHERTKST